MCEFEGHFIGACFRCDLSFCLMDLHFRFCFKLTVRNYYYFCRVCFFIETSSYCFTVILCSCWRPTTLNVNRYKGTANCFTYIQGLRFRVLVAIFSLQSGLSCMLYVHWYFRFGYGGEGGRACYKCQVVGGPVLIYLLSDFLLRLR